KPLVSHKTHHANVRLLSATNSDLEAEVGAGRFREDLLFRLNTVELRLPPLRDRRDDIPLLAAYFLRQYATRYGKRVTGFHPDAMRTLLNNPWPGNVRELAHSVERATLLAEGETIRSAELSLGSSGGSAPLR